MVQLAHIVNTILIRAKQENIPITPMKLQKLVYFIYGAYLLKTGTPLFSERFEKWQYGPVIGDIYQAFKEYGSREIKSYMPDVNGNFQMIDLSTAPCLATQFNNVWDRFSAKSGIELSKITHNKSGAWFKAYESKETLLKDEDILDEMKGHFNAA